MAFGRLERPHPGAKPMSEINVTPLVDVMLVLVVIFIITAPLLTSAIRLDLPKSASTKAGQPPDFVSVAIDASGKFFVNDRSASLQDLSASLAEAATRNPDTEVQLRADESVPYGKVVEVMGAAQKAGLARIGFVAEPLAAASGR